MKPLMNIYLTITPLVLVVIGQIQRQDQSPPQVITELGTLRGFYQTSEGGRMIASFQSIPYVKQPMGRHRFKNSIEMSPWLGVYDATSEPPDCMQLPPSVVGDVSGTEDCLYLNVYTPYVPSGMEVRPLMDVLVYIHGGGFMYYGSKYFSPKYLLDRDVVLVTFNYRMGPLGFLSTGDATISGNAGMKDQVMALRWVQRYISSFGGDPNKVTLSGHSAGASSVHFHVISPLSKGLFHKAIISGGSVLNPWSYAENVTEKTLSLAASMGCAFHDSNLLVKCLRSRPAQHIVAYSKQLLGWYDVPLAPWAPTVEPVSSTVGQNPPGSPLPFLDEDPMAILSSGRAHDVPIMFAYTQHEGAIPAAFFVFNDTLRSDLMARFEEVLPHLLDFYYTVDSGSLTQICQKIKDFYLKDADLLRKEKSVDPIVQMISDRLFTSGIVEASLIHASKYTSPVYNVKLSYQGVWSQIDWACKCNESLNGAIHYDDAAAFIDNTYPTASETLDVDVRTHLIDLWYSFIKTGRPQYGSFAVPDLKTSLPSFTYLDIGSDGNPTIITDNDAGNASFWKSLGLKENGFTVSQVHSEL